jgi:hypothetical protein
VLTLLNHKGSNIVVCHQLESVIKAIIRANANNIWPFLIKNLLDVLEHTFSYFPLN